MFVLPLSVYFVSSCSWLFIRCFESVCIVPSCLSCLVVSVFWTLFLNFWVMQRQHECYGKFNVSMRVRVLMRVHVRVHLRGRVRVCLLVRVRVRVRARMRMRVRVRVRLRGRVRVREKAHATLDVLCCHPLHLLHMS